MSTKRQHYVPKVYLKSWETMVCNTREPNKPFRGIYMFADSDMNIGKGITIDKVLFSNHTYTIDYEHEYVLQHCPKVGEDFSSKIEQILVRRNVEAFLRGEKINPSVEICNQLSIVDQWCFIDKVNGQHRPNKPISNEIKSIHSYVIEDAFNKHVENKWEQVLSRFVSETDKIIACSITSGTAQEMINMFLFMVCRNPTFDGMGIFPAIHKAFFEPLIRDAKSEEAEMGFSKLSSKMIWGAWITEIYKALFKGNDGYAAIMQAAITEKCNLILYRISDPSDGCFITSDNPACQYSCALCEKNVNTMFFPLTPNRLLQITGRADGKNGYIECRTVNNSEIRKLNMAILNCSSNLIITNRKTIGYIM